MQLPAPLQRLKDLWMAMSHAMGRVVSWILLSVLWLVVFGIYAVILKLFTACRRAKSPSSYWRACPAEFPDGMRHQF